MNAIELAIFTMPFDTGSMIKPLLLFFMGMAGVAALIYVSRLLISNIR